MISRGRINHSFIADWTHEKQRDWYVLAFEKNEKVSRWLRIESRVPKRARHKRWVHELCETDFVFINLTSHNRIEMFLHAAESEFCNVEQLPLFRCGWVSGASYLCAKSLGIAIYLNVSGTVMWCPVCMTSWFVARPSCRLADCVYCVIIGGSSAIGLGQKFSSFGFKSILIAFALSRLSHATFAPAMHSVSATDLHLVKP